MHQALALAADSKLLHPLTMLPHAQLDSGPAAAGKSCTAALAPAAAGSGPTVQSWVSQKLNAQQRQAVQMVVRGASGRRPYLIWGPPGTGKTSTVVEAAAQVLAGIRVCLASVSVCDCVCVSDCVCLRLIVCVCPQAYYPCGSRADNVP